MTAPRGRLEMITSLITSVGVLLGVGFTAYVRNHDFCPAQQPAPQCTAQQSDLSGADLRRADLRGALGMSPDEIRAVADTDSETRFGDQAVPEPSAVACSG